MSRISMVRLEELVGLGPGPRDLSSNIRVGDGAIREGCAVYLLSALIRWDGPFL